MKRTQLAIILSVLAVATLAWLWWSRTRPAEPPAPQRPAATRKTEITLYFANRAYVQTGDESLPHLVPEKRLLDLEKGNRAAVVLDALKSGPATEEAAPIIREDIEIIGVKVEEGTALVDLSPRNLSGGSLEEMLLIQGMVRTLTGLPGIEAVRFLINGEPADTLMGHISVDKPWTAADVR